MAFCPTCGADPCINPAFCKSCRSADRAAVKQRDPDKLASLRRLLNTNISLDRVWHELNRQVGGPQSTIEALMWSLRERGTVALAEPDTRRRLSECSDEQIIEVGRRLQRLKRHIGLGPWCDDDIRVLFRIKQGKAK